MAELFFRGPVLLYTCLREGGSAKNCDETEHTEAVLRGSDNSATIYYSVCGQDALEAYKSLLQKVQRAAARIPAPSKQGISYSITTHTLYTRNEFGDYDSWGVYHIVRIEDLKAQSFEHICDDEKIHKRDRELLKATVCQLYGESDFELRNDAKLELLVKQNLFFAVKWSWLDGERPSTANESQAVARVKAT